jgi:hypothetical protein
MTYSSFISINQISLGLDKALRKYFRYKITSPGKSVQMSRWKRRSDSRLEKGGVQREAQLTARQTYISVARVINAARCEFGGYRPDTDHQRGAGRSPLNLLTSPAPALRACLKILENGGAKEGQMHSNRGGKGVPGPYWHGCKQGRRGVPPQASPRHQSITMEEQAREPIGQAAPRWRIEARYRLASLSFI